MRTVTEQERWGNLQREVSEWATRNFGDTGAWMPWNGVIEEIGEFYSFVAPQEYVFPTMPALYRIERGNRGAVIDAIGDQAIYALNLCEKVGISFAADISPNLPQNITERELLGCLAMGCRAILKHEQGIRDFTFDKRRDHMLIAISMWYRWAYYQVELHKLPDVLPITEQVWDEVKHRDWVKNPSDANVVAKQ